VFSSRKSKTSFSKGTEKEKSKKSNNSSEIFILDLKSGQQTQITHNTHLDVYPNWSPDGSKIVFCSCKNGYLELYIMKVDGSSQTKLNLN
jgi:TolB protein